jgi:hypothetical protein
MKLVIVVVFVLLGLLWTGLAALTAGGLQWAAGALASGSAGDLAAAMGSWQLPTWLVQGLDLGWLMGLQAALVTAVDMLQQWWPGVGQVVGWLVPVVWITWGLGMALLLLLGVLAYLAWGRLSRSGQPPTGGAAARAA